jgi:hypothetical protein
MCPHWTPTGLQKISKVGKSIAEKITEFLRTGRVRALEQLREKVPAGVLNLTRIPTLGPKKAMALHEELGDFADGGETGLDPGFGDDRFADYPIVVTAGDEPIDWLQAGEATSAVWLTATANRLAMSSISDVVEVAGAWALFASLRDGTGHPQLVLRTGFQRQPRRHRQVPAARCATFSTRIRP